MKIRDVAQSQVSNPLTPCMNCSAMRSDLQALVHVESCTIGVETGLVRSSRDLLLRAHPADSIRDKRLHIQYRGTGSLVRGTRSVAASAVIRRSFRERILVHAQATGTGNGAGICTGKFICELAVSLALRGLPDGPCWPTSPPEELKLSQTMESRTNTKRPRTDITLSRHTGNGGGCSAGIPVSECVPVPSPHAR